MPAARLYPGYIPNSDGSGSEDDGDRVQDALPHDGESEDDLDWKLQPKVVGQAVHVAHNGNYAEPSRKRQRVEGGGNGAHALAGPSSSSLAPAPAQAGQGPSSASLGDQPAHHPMPGLRMKSFFGWQPADEISKVVGEWLLRVCWKLQNVEVCWGERRDGA